ncbi:hypothetical protein Sgou_38840 [Streptomyces gougerotii]|uniref:Uncharacterized protein n=2 Tax=Streptomyces diastaticus group TaxID=2849069 RepID=A0A8H9LMW3_9ACTN|nr:hypothetical protein Srut_50940 [Streptomyces rutgersensis]GFH73614.1 hypothetical protein Sdia_43820 [Streptomyces diastaticus subsp. diastaticus]GFH79214.1 hypothetical protein Sgou_38840 [Streptomyces gougerotii]GGU08386.1 hypothetical protein GCM10015534_08150 [Streptomyces diastaticus subsp. diastaticus]GGU55047.1 hypothetical protein GCM10010227_05350 [Streptomyces gougerotii]
MVAGSVPEAAGTARPGRRPKDAGAAPPVRCGARDGARATRAAGAGRGGVCPGPAPAGGEENPAVPGVRQTETP